MYFPDERTKKEERKKERGKDKKKEEKERGRDRGRKPLTYMDSKPLTCEFYTHRKTDNISQGTGA